MSLLSRDRILALVGSDEITVVRKGGLFRRAVSDCEIYAVPSGIAELGVVSLLGTILNDSRWSNAPIRVVLNDASARYAVVPWSGKSLSPAAKEAHARFMLTDLYGEDLAAWRLAIEDTSPGYDALVSAVSGEIIEAIQVLASNGAQIESVRPLLVEAFDQLRAKLRGDCWLATWASGHLTAARISGGRILSVETRRGSKGAIAELDKVLALGSLTSANNAAQRCCLFGLDPETDSLNGVAIEYFPEGDFERPISARMAEMLCL